VAAPAFAHFYRGLLELYPDTPRHFERPEGVMEGNATTGTELFTAISPLPGHVQNTPAGIAEMFGHVERPGGDTADEGRAQEEADTGDMEVIEIDDEPVTHEPIVVQEEEPNPPQEPIDPLNLKPKRPQPVGDGSGSMF
jgi:GDP-D-mannose dehydratase